MQASLVHVAADQFTSPVTTRVRTPNAPSRFVRNAPGSPSTPVSTVRLPFLELEEFAARGIVHVVTPETPQTPLARAIVHVVTPETPDENNVEDFNDVLPVPRIVRVHDAYVARRLMY